MGRAAAAYGAVGAVAGDGEGEDGGAGRGGGRGGSEALLDDDADEAGRGRRRRGRCRGCGVEGLLHDLTACRVRAAGLVPPLRRSVHRGWDGSGALRGGAFNSERGSRGSAAPKFKRLVRAEMRRSGLDISGSGNG